MFLAVFGGGVPHFADPSGLSCMQTDDVCPVDDPELTVCPIEASFEQE